MRIIVTGGCGFIGSHVVDCLIADGHRVMALDNFFSGRDHWLKAAMRPEIRQVDITQRRPLSVAFQEWKPEVVFHLAGHPYIPFCEKDPVAAYDLNVVGTHNVLALSWNSGVERLFFASSAEVYAPSFRAQREDDPAAPFTVYGRTKLLAEWLCRGALDWGWNASVLVGRIFDAVGPRETSPHTVPDIIRQINEAAPVQGLGNPLLARDFVDVQALARTIVNLTFDIAGFEIVNIGSGVPVTLQQMVDTIAAAAKRPIEPVSDPSRPPVTERVILCADTSRLRRFVRNPPKAADEGTILQILVEYEYERAKQNWSPLTPAATGNGNRG